MLPLESIHFRADRAAVGEPDVPRESISDWAGRVGIKNMAGLLDYLRREAEGTRQMTGFALAPVTLIMNRIAGLDEYRLVLWLMEEELDWLAVRERLMSFASPLTESEAAVWEREVPTHDNTLMTMPDGVTVRIDLPDQRLRGGRGGAA